MYPHVLHQIEAFLNEEVKLHMLCKSSPDGRINSIQDEATIIDCLMSSSMFQISRPTSTRHWCDFLVHMGNVTIPINIKVSRGGTDNALDKKAIVFSYSTLPEHLIPSSMSFNTMMELIESHRKSERSFEKEYYYLYMDKCDGRILIRSICDIKNFVSNPQNWLQIAWKRERQEVCDYCGDVNACFDRLRRTLALSLKKLIENTYKILTLEERSEIYLA